MRAWLQEVWRRSVASESEALQTPAQADASVVVVLLSAAVLLTMREYVFDAQGVAAALRGLGFDFYGQPGRHDRLVELACWSLGQAMCYLALPALMVKLVLRGRLSEYGLKLRGATHYWWAYAGMFAVMLPLILLMARTGEFQSTYPFYDPPRGEPLWPRFWMWQALYWMQFLSLEFFFRGYLIHGTRKALGPYAILVAMVPYCMIHFGKPLPETLGSIVAGVVLGTMSYATRSIWLGAALHIGVAVTMDLAALAAEGRLS